MSKKFRDELDQPQIKEFIVINQASGSETPRSSSVKRKPSPSVELTREAKKLVTSPDITKMANNKEEVLIKEANIDSDVLKALEVLLEPLRTDIKRLTTSHMEIKRDVKDNAILQEENKVLTERIKKVEMTNDKLLSRVCELENRLLETNIIMQGIREGPWETEDARTEKVYDAMTETVLGRNYDDRLETAKLMTIKSTRRIGTYSSMRSRPIAIEFMYKSDVDYLLRNKKYFGEGIYVDREYCKETEEKRRILRPYLRAARQIPKYQRKCRLDGDTLVLRGISYTTEKLEDLPEELKGYNISSKSDQNTIGFFGMLNPFSNFYPAKFSFGGKDYSSSEQMIQHTKAKYFRDEELARRIMDCESAHECQKLSKEILNYNREEWEDQAKQQCFKGIEEKFKQNESLKQQLLDTGNKTLVESCYDSVWGTGVPLRDHGCLNPRKWTGQGILGEILEQVRQNLRGTSDTEYGILKHGDSSSELNSKTTKNTTTAPRSRAINHPNGRNLKTVSY